MPERDGNRVTNLRQMEKLTCAVVQFFKGFLEKIYSLWKKWNDGEISSCFKSEITEEEAECI